MQQPEAAARIGQRSGRSARRPLCLRTRVMRTGFKRHERMVCAGILRRTHRFSLTGSHGFGYDPLFFYPPFGKTFGEIDRATKAAVSHRGKALKKLAEMLPKLVDFAAQP